jgi:hypothetical protein
MYQFAAQITNGRETSIFDWMAKFAAYPQKPWIIGIISAAVAAILAELILRLRYTKLTGIALRAIGLLFILYGLALIYVKFRVHAVDVPSTTWIWMPSAGIILFACASGLHRIRARLARERTKRIVDFAADRIMILEQTRGASHFVDQFTQSEEPALPLVRSMINQRRKGKKESLVIISGPSGAGKTATLLRYAASCRETQSSRRRPLIAIYVDLAAYAAQFNENPTLEDFIQDNFTKNDSPDLNLEKAWAASGRYIDWIFLFDNADEADLWQGSQIWSRQIIENFLKRYSRSNSFRALVAAYVSQDSPIGAVIELGNLTDDGWREFLGNSGISRVTVDAIAADEGLYWFLKDPGAINFLAPVLARHPWATGDSVNEALRESVDNAFNSSTQTDALRTATAVIKSLIRTPGGYYADEPGDITKKLADIGQLINLPAQEIDTNLSVLEEHDILKRIRSRHGDYIKFSPASAAYFYSCALLDGPGELTTQELLCDERFRMITISLLQVARREYVNQFLTEMSSLLDSAIDALNKDQLELLAEQIEVLKNAKRLQSVRRAESILEDRYARAERANAALFALIGGLQNRLDLLDEEMRHKLIEFTKLVMPICDPRMQAHVLAIRYAIDPPSNEAVKPDPGLDSKDGQVVLDTTSRIVNSLNETTGLPEADQSKLVAVVLLAGLSSLTLTRGRGNLPASLRLANDAGIAMIILYGTIFGVGGLLQLTSDWRSPFLQVCEILISAVVTGPLIASRHLPSWRLTLLRFNFYIPMKYVSISLASLGAIWAILDLLYDLLTFTMPLMPLLACYSLMWPAYVGFYLTYDPNPSATKLIFPSPAIAKVLWHTHIVKLLRSFFQ